MNALLSLEGLGSKGEAAAPEYAGFDSELAIACFEPSSLVVSERLRGKTVDAASDKEDSANANEAESVAIAIGELVLMLRLDCGSSVLVLARMLARVIPVLTLGTGLFVSWLAAAALMEWSISEVGSILLEDGADESSGPVFATSVDCASVRVAAEPIRIELLVSILVVELVHIDLRRIDVVGLL